MIFQIFIIIFFILSVFSFSFFFFFVFLYFFYENPYLVNKKKAKNLRGEKKYTKRNTMRTPISTCNIANNYHFDYVELSYKHTLFSSCLYYKQINKQETLFWLLYYNPSKYALGWSLLVCKYASFILIYTFCPLLIKKSMLFLIFEYIHILAIVFYIFCHPKSWKVYIFDTFGSFL